MKRGLPKLNGFGHGFTLHSGRLRCGDKTNTKYPDRRISQSMPFVDNRVAEIQRLTNPSSWQHVSTKNDPADLVSRGVSPKNIINSQFVYKIQVKIAICLKSNTSSGRLEIRRGSGSIVNDISEKDQIISGSDIIYNRTHSISFLHFKWIHIGIINNDRRTVERQKGERKSGDRRMNGGDKRTETRRRGVIRKFVSPNK
ncbi:hypothetical protein NQ318_010556 [Aromia moschata]|uniref:Ribosomal protein S3 n=1 Tax=Aromia moschata TaxID=1265417 RepID=A0AAV8X6U3_9CUCU|nr:hypothetical protein NQ318_010556 [Aromia moschata]